MTTGPMVRVDNTIKQSSLPLGDRPHGIAVDGDVLHLVDGAAGCDDAGPAVRDPLDRDRVLDRGQGGLSRQSARPRSSLLGASQRPVLAVSWATLALG